MSEHTPGWMRQWQGQGDDLLDYGLEEERWYPVGYSIQGLAYLRAILIHNLSRRFPREHRADWEYLETYRDLMRVKAETGRR